MTRRDETKQTTANTETKLNGTKRNGSKLKGECNSQEQRKEDKKAFCISKFTFKMVQKALCTASGQHLIAYKFWR